MSSSNRDLIVWTRADEKASADAPTNGEHDYMPLLQAVPQSSRFRRLIETILVRCAVRHVRREAGSVNADRHVATGDTLGGSCIRSPVISLNTCSGLLCPPYLPAWLRMARLSARDFTARITMSNAKMTGITSAPSTNSGLTGNEIACRERRTAVIRLRT